jgi:hypothetical protein
MSRGAVPKVNRVRDADGRRRQQEFRTIAADGEAHGPDLPDGDWPEQTRHLYETLRRDAIGTQLTPAEWLHVIDTMRLHSMLWSDEPSNAIKVAAEVRLRLQSLGITPEARMKLRLMVDEPAPESKLEELRRRHDARSLAPGSARRRRLMKAVADANEADKPIPALSKKETSK